MPWGGGAARPSPRPPPSPAAGPPPARASRCASWSTAAPASPSTRESWPRGLRRAPSSPSPILPTPSAWPPSRHGASRCSGARRRTAVWGRSICSRAWAPSTSRASCSKAAGSWLAPFCERDWSTASSPLSLPCSWADAPRRGPSRAPGFGGPRRCGWGASRRALSGTTGGSRATRKHREAARRFPGRTPRARARRRGRLGDRARSGGGDGATQNRVARSGPGAPAHSPGIGGRGRGKPDRGCAGGRGFRDHADPAYTGAHDSGGPQAGTEGQPRDGRDRKVRAARAELERGATVTMESRREFASIEAAVEDIRAGQIIMVVDDEDRENEGDFLMAADRVTPEAVNFMIMHGRGLMCMPMLAERLDELQIPMMVSDNTAPLGTAFTVSVDARRGVTTGISAYDRAVTIRTLVSPTARPDDLARPGHIFPLRAMPGGVLRRAGHTEAAIDLARLAGCYPAGVICEILNDEGGMARVPDLLALGRRHGLKCITIRDLIEYRIHQEKLVRRAATTQLPTE